MRPDFSRSIIGSKSPESWSALPTADERWTYAETRATRWTEWFAVFTALTATMLASGLLMDLPISAIWFWILGGCAALCALMTWKKRRFFRNLDEAANGHSGR